MCAIALGCGSKGSSPRAERTTRAPTPATRSTSGHIPRALLAQARPIGAGKRFHPPAHGSPVGACKGRLGPRYGVHVEVFAANRVVLFPAGIGTLPPRTLVDGRVTRAQCYSALVTLDPTGLVLVRIGAHVRVSDLFRAWGQPLSSRRLGPFIAYNDSRVVAFVDGRAWRGRPQDVPLLKHGEIVLEVGPRVPPHASYTFPPGT